MKLTIFISHRKDLPSEIVSNDIFLPFSCGSYFTKKLWSSNLNRDDVGENISDLSPYYSELTVQYWAWKNLEAEYYGLFHYRRFLSFTDERNVALDSWSNVVEKQLTEEALRKHKLLDINFLKDEIKKYDAILPIPVNLKNNNYESVRSQYCKASMFLHEDDLNILEDVIKELYPNYLPYFYKYFNGEKAIFCNLFIMKKDLFFEYSEFVFSVLKAFRQKKDISLYSIEEARVLGHLGERLLGVFHEKLKEKGDCNISYRPILFFKNTWPQTPEYWNGNYIAPTKKSESIPVVLSTSEEFSPYCAVTIESIIRSKASEDILDFFILYDSLNKVSQEKIAFLKKRDPNISIRFICVNEFLEQYNLSGQIPKQTYFRLVIPEVFKDYDKVIYLDSDLIVRSSLRELFETDLSTNLVAAVRDISDISTFFSKKTPRTNYINDVLRLKHPENIFNAGVLLINIKEFRKEYDLRYILEFVEAGNFQFQDQDGLNVLCQGKVKFLSQIWNFSADPVDDYVFNMSKYAPREVAMDYYESGADFRIIHYIGKNKPWQDPKFRRAEYFWDIAKDNCFFYSKQGERATGFLSVNRKKLIVKILVAYIGGKLTFGRLKRFFGKKKEEYFKSLGS